MSFFRRILSSDYRRAIAAEAAGNLDVAAEHYGLAGEREGAVRMHLLRAARAGSRALEIAALRDALHWAGQDEALRQKPAAALGGALLAVLEAEGIGTQRDRERLREAAELLVLGGEHQRAGDALAKIGDHLAAANAFSAGGLVEAMEEALAKDDDGQRRARQEQEAFASYQANLSVGRRDEARADLQRCVAGSANAEYRRLLDTLESRLITAGRVELVIRGRPALVVCAVKRVVLGRDALCDLALRSGGVSRQHAEIEVQADPPRYVLHDLGSRNGTKVAGLPLAGSLPLGAPGTFSLGDECTLEHELISAGATVMAPRALSAPRGAGGPGVPDGDGGALALAMRSDAPPVAARAAVASAAVASTAEAAGAEEAAGAAALPRVLRLRVSAGLDRGTVLLVAPEQVAVALACAELGVSITFRNGRPFLAGAGARELRFCGEPLGAVAVQLIRGDKLCIDGVDVDIG